MDFKAIEELIQTINSTKLTSLEIESEGTRIKMVKGPDKVVTINDADISNNCVADQEKLQTVSTAKVLIDENYHIIKSPIVGTFYSSAAPGKSNFVSVGTKVKKGCVLCILEAMKLMNEIECDVDGVVVEVLAKSEDMVEYGQPLFKITQTTK